ncbi:MAG: AAA family ATPase, partial [Candidatus Binatia bacterium]
LQKGHTVALLIDEAQNLSDEALEGLRLLSNLETDREKLLQIVLMGQPELELKLAQPQLRQLRQRVAHQCSLAPLKDQEVKSFIDFRLQAVGYEGEGLFNPDAVKRIAFYSKGIPRLINIVCDNALLIAYGTSQRTVSVQMIEEVADDLRLKEESKAIRAVEAPAIKVAVTNGNEGASRAVEERPHQVKPRQLAWVGIGTLLLLLLLEGGVTIYSQQTEHDLADLRLKVGNFLGIIGEHFEFSKITGYRQASKESQTSSETVGVDERQVSAEEQAQLRQSSISKDRARTQVSGDLEIRRRKIELKINQAIRNRAIAGVEVSFMKGTAYLEGQVETENQKTAAEQAARSVPEVKEVRSSISLNPLLLPLLPER